MKIRNKKTNNIFNLPKTEVEILLEANPELYEKMTTTKTKKNACNIVPMYEQNTILPLIWEKQDIKNLMEEMKNNIVNYD